MNFYVFVFYICCFVIVNNHVICVFRFASVVRNKSTTTHSTQFMVRTEEISVLYLYTEFEADSYIRSKVIYGVPKFGNWVT